VIYCFQIPGFYFDPDKKRYYRIVAGHDDTISGAITARVIASRNEHKRAPVTPVLDDIKRQRTDALHSSFVSSFQSMQIGKATASNVRSQILSGIVRNLAWHNTVPILPEVVDEEEYNFSDSYLKQIFCTADENQLVCLWCLRSRCSNAIQRLQINDAAKSCSERTTFQYIPVGCQHSAMQFRGIMSACVAETNILHDCHVTPVLYTAAVHCQPFQIDTLAVLDPLYTSHSDQLQLSESLRTFYVGKKWVWSCAWSPGLNNQFAIGTEKLAYIFDANTGKRFTLNTRSSDVLSQAFTSPVSICPFEVITYPIDDLLKQFHICV